MYRTRSHTEKNWNWEYQIRKMSGRPTKLIKSDCKYLKIISLRNRTKSCQELSSDLVKKCGTQVHSLTIRRALLKEDLHGRVVRGKPYLRQENRQKRLEFDKEHKKLTVEQWNDVLWGDESKFEILNLKRRVGEQMKDVCLKPLIKHGICSIMVWGCLSANGVVDLVRIDEIKNAGKYKFWSIIQSPLLSVSLVIVSFSSKITIPSALN